MKFFQLIGTQRSGSNLFRLMLNEFDDVFAPHPPHLLKTFINLLPKYNSLQNDNDARRLVKDMIKWIQFNPVPWNYIPNVDEVIKQSKENSIFNFFEKIYVLGAKNASKKKYWFCKSLYNLNFFNDEMFNKLDPIYIYIYRDGRDVAASFKNASIGDKHIFFLAKKWEKDQIICRKIKENTNTFNFFEVRYEDLLNNPKSILKSFCDKYDIVYNDKFLNFYKSNDSKITSLSGKLWKNLSRPLIKNNFEKYKEELSPEEIKIFESINYYTLNHLNYKNNNSTNNLIKNFSKESIQKFDEINNILKEENKLRNKTLEMKLRKRQKSILLR